MNLKKFGIILFLIFSLLPINKILAQTTNAGFVPGNIWYSKDPFEEGDKIKIYTLIFNPDSRKFSGTVDFFDNSTLLGTKDFNIAGTSTKDISISWTVTAGDHEIFGQIENAKFLQSNGTYQNASITDNVTSKSSRTVSKKVVTENINNTVNSVDGAFNTAVNSIQNIGDTAKSLVPVSAMQSVNKTTNTIDGWREGTGNILQNSQEETQNKINSLNNTKNLSKNTQNANAIEKPFEYAKLFFFTIFSAILKNKILFYGISVVLALLILRYIWNLFF